MSDDEVLKAFRDIVVTGQGYMLDGKHVPIQDVDEIKFEVAELQNLLARCLPYVEEFNDDRAGPAVSRKTSHH